MGRHPKNSLKLTQAELARAFEGRWGEEFPPVLNVKHAARLADVTVKTLYDWSHRGMLAQCARRRGKRLRIFRENLRNQGNDFPTGITLPTDRSQPELCGR